VPGPGFWRGAFWLFALQGLAFIIASVALIDAAPSSGQDTGSRTPLRQLAVLTAGIAAMAAAGLVTDLVWSALLGLSGLLLIGLFLILDGRALRGSCRIAPATR